jgi:YD repeat-containing protein
VTALHDAVLLISTDRGAADRFRADPAEFAREHGLSASEVNQLLELRDDTSADSSPSVLGARVSKSAIGAAGMGALFHAFSGGTGDTAPAATLVPHPGAGTDGTATDGTGHAGTGHDGSSSTASSTGPAPGHEGPQAGDHVDTSADGSTTTTHHPDGSYEVTNNRDGTFRAYNSTGQLVEYTERAVLDIPPNPDAISDMDGAGHIRFATWDDAGGHHTAVPDPLGALSWTDTAVQPDGTHVVTTISEQDDRYFNSEQVITAPDGASTDVSYDIYGHLTSVSGDGPSSWTDSTGHHDVVHSPDGSLTTTSTAADGSRVVLVSTGGHAVSQTSYDAAGHQTVMMTFNPDGSNNHAEGTVTSDDGRITTTYHDDGGRTVTNNTDGTFIIYGPRGSVIEYTERAVLDIPPNPDAISDMDGAGHIRFATWDDAGGHHTAVPDPLGALSWTDTAVQPDGTHVVTTISEQDDRYFNSEQVITAPDGASTDVSYDIYGHLTSVSGDGPSSWTDSTGHHDVVHSPDGSLTTTSTAADGSRVVLVSTGGHAVSQTSYDAAGHQTVMMTFNPDGSNNHAEGTVTSDDGRITTTYHDDGGRTVTNNTDGTFIIYGPRGSVIEYTERAVLDIPPNPDAISDMDGAGHIRFATWDDAGGHHTAVPDPHGGTSWTDTAVQPDGTQVVTTISLGGSDQYYNSEQVVTAPDGTITETTYDDHGNVLSVTHPGAGTDPSSASPAATPAATSSTGSASTPPAVHAVEPVVTTAPPVAPPTSVDHIAHAEISTNAVSLLSSAHDTETTKPPGGDDRDLAGVVVPKP